MGSVWAPDELVLADAPPRRIPCTCSVRAGARRWPTRLSPCTSSVGAVARRSPTRRSPCTCAGARRCSRSRIHCTCSRGTEGRPTLSLALSPRPLLSSLFAVSSAPGRGVQGVRWGLMLSRAHRSSQAPHEASRGPCEVLRSRCRLRESWCILGAESWHPTC